MQSSQNRMTESANARLRRKKENKNLIMKYRNRNDEEVYPALITIQEAARYAACGTQTARRIAEEVGALIKIAPRCLRVDREKFLNGIREKYSL